MNPADPIHVLLLEDNPTDAFLVRSALAAADGRFEVQQVDTLKEARAALSDPNSYQLIVSDLNLPDSSRDTTLEFLLREREHLPVVVLNACDDPALKHQCAARGAACYSKQKLLDKAFVHTLHEQMNQASQPSAKH